MLKLKHWEVKKSFFVFSSVKHVTQKVQWRLKDVNAPLFDQILMRIIIIYFLPTSLISPSLFLCSLSMRCAFASDKSHIAGPSHHDSSRTVDFGGQNHCATHPILTLQYSNLCCVQATQKLTITHLSEVYTPSLTTTNSHRTNERSLSTILKCI
jgi:hypothetical protein